MIKAKLISQPNDTICALATPPGMSAISIIRISGPKSFEICDQLFNPRNKKLKLKETKTHTIHLGEFKAENELIDEVLISVFRKPNSYTGEDSIEISCHGSEYIQQKIIELLIDKGIRIANPGEFTLRAFINGKFDLSQAEAVADLIASQSKISHDLALDQMRGKFSDILKDLRKQLLNFASLIELELDFSEEDVEFADRGELVNVLNTIEKEIENLINSFSVGNVIKKGIPVAIVGKPNVGKSTLLNAILNEERAIVSEMPGTTRDTIEDTIIINGVSFRFIDTAGLRVSTDKIESIGIERTYEKIDKAKVILYVFDINKTNCDEVKTTMEEFIGHIKNLPTESSRDKKFILIANKTDMLVEAPHGFISMVEMECLFVSAKRKENINLIIDLLSKYIEKEKVTDTTIVTNTRHYDALVNIRDAIKSIKQGFKDEIPSDLIATDIRNALHHLGEITGEITTNEILDNIFSKFCIGK